MLPSQPPMLEESERKLYTLLVLRELGSSTHLQLLQFMVENKIMSYFDLTLALYELVSEGHVSKINGAADSLYQITEAGNEALGFFINRIPHSKAELIHREAPIWRRRIDTEKSISSQIIQNSGGEYVAYLKLTDGQYTMLKIEIPVPEYQMAKTISESWHNRAPGSP